MVCKIMQLIHITSMEFGGVADKIHNSQFCKQGLDHRLYWEHAQLTDQRAIYIFGIMSTYTIIDQRMIQQKHRRSSVLGEVVKVFML